MQPSSKTLIPRPRRLMSRADMFFTFKEYPTIAPTAFADLRSRNWKTNDSDIKRVSVDAISHVMLRPNTTMTFSIYTHMGKEITFLQFADTLSENACSNLLIFMSIAELVMFSRSVRNYQTFYHKPIMPLTVYRPYYDAIISQKNEKKEKLISVLNSIIYDSTTSDIISRNVSAIRTRLDSFSKQLPPILPNPPLAPTPE